MEIRLKERLVGALVLVAIAVVVVPWILDNDKERQSFESEIPDAPPLQPSRVIELSQPRPIDESAFDNSVISGTSFADETRQTSETEAGHLADAELTDISGSDAQVVDASSAVNSGTQNTSSETTSSPSTEEKKPEPFTTKDGFVVQLGSFGNKANAERLVADLRAKGLKAYAKDDKSVKPAVHRVLIGPVLHREQAEKLQEKAKQLSGLNAIVQSFDPLRH